MSFFVFIPVNDQIRVSLNVSPQVRLNVPHPLYIPNISSDYPCPLRSLQNPAAKPYGVQAPSVPLKQDSQRILRHIGSSSRSVSKSAAVYHRASAISSSTPPLPPLLPLATRTSSSSLLFLTSPASLPPIPQLCSGLAIITKSLMNRRMHPTRHDKRPNFFNASASHAESG